MSLPLYEKRGYLQDELRLFPLCDEPASLSQISSHYHEFHKLILFKNGNVSYSVEGTHYTPEPGDVLVIGRGCVHRPQVHAGAQYSRTVLYLSPEFLRAHSTPECDLELCFTEAMRTGSHILRTSGSRLRHITELFASLENASKSDEFGTNLFMRCGVIQLVITLSRYTLGRSSSVSGAIHDEKTLELLRYIGENLTSDISIDALSERFFISKYHMMRKFRLETGYTIHAYISTKRLLLARELISGGTAATDACYISGFRDYSAFSRAYVKLFGSSPGGRRRFHIDAPQNASE